MKHDVVVIGGGAAGLGAAKSLAQKGLDVVLVHKGAPGGGLPNLEWVENFPQTGAKARGAELAALFLEQAQSAGVHFLEGEVAELELYSRSVAAILVDQRAVTAAYAVVATGRRKRQLESLDIERFEGRGLIGCAACEAVFYRDASVVVCGSGHAGALDALYLSRFAKEVTLIERTGELGCGDALQDRLQDAGNVRVLRNKALAGASGPASMEGVQIRDATGETFTVAATGLSIQVGHQPETEFLAGSVAVDECGYVLADRSRQSRTQRVFAIGDVRSGARRTVSEAIADGHVACETISELLRLHPAG